MGREYFDDLLNVRAQEEADVNGRSKRIRLSMPSAVEKIHRILRLCMNIKAYGGCYKYMG